MQKNMKEKFGGIGFIYPLESKKNIETVERLL
jgi:hypothetical protein